MAAARRSVTPVPSPTIATLGEAPTTGSGQPRDLAPWLRRAIAALGVAALVLLVTGVHLTFEYRPADRVDVRDADPRPGLVAAAQVLHAVAGYAFVVLVCVVVGLALVVAHRRGYAAGTILASGVGLFLVSIGFLLTGLQLPWSGFVRVATGAAEDFDGIFGFPREVVAVLVGGDEVNPSRYETVAWIHVAGLTVFAVFATWWLLGALQAARTDVADAPRGSTTVAAPPAEPPRPVTVAEQLFGTDDPDLVRRQVDAFLERHLGTGIAALDFTRTGSGVLLGVTLADGRPVVVRFHPPGADARHLRAVQEVQRALAHRGFPAPGPLLEPVPFGVGLATVEGRLHEPPPADPTDRETRRVVAQGLAVLVRLAAPYARHPDLAGRGPVGPPAPGTAFPAPPEPGLDFAATAPGAEWIEELGGRARALLAASPVTTPVVGHFAWRLEHVGVADGHLHAVFDWGRLGSAPEPVVVGSAAHQFTIDGRTERPHVPTAEEIREFVLDYEAARGAPLGGPERVAARAAYVFCTAYAARCEHALAAIGRPVPAGFRERLAGTGAALLR